MLEVAAAAGEPLDDADGPRSRRAAAAGPRPSAWWAATGRAGCRWRWWWATARWACWCSRTSQLADPDRRLLGTFANQAALAVDRARLREEALRTRLLEEVDRWRSALMGAASHDLRTPLAGIKAAVSSLRQVDAQLGPEDRAELLELIELQTDRLARLVSNLLDMTRIESGALELRPAAVAFDELVTEALHSLSGLVAPAVSPSMRPRASRSCTSTTSSWARCWPTCSRTPSGCPPTTSSIR